MSDNNSNKNQQLNIELPEELAEGIYSNLAVISHSNSEFVIDFIRMMPGVPKAKVKSRLIMTPQHAKRLLAALNENIIKFENAFGEIEFPEGGQAGFPGGFGGPTGIA